jgi:RhtB (resistance to homoserine/threonine) family protein
MYWAEFLKVAVAHLLAVASPGPDFAIVLRQSLARGRGPAVWTAVGIGCGICLHVTYSLLGIGLLIKGSPVAFTCLKFAGAAYLAWVGVRSFRAPPQAPAAPEAAGARRGTGAWTAGFLTNALNPKATLFFVALFAVVISPDTPRVIQACYGVWLSLATMAWFSFVAFIFTRESVRRFYLARGHWIDRALGAVFLAFAASLVATARF